MIGIALWQVNCDIMISQWLGRGYSLTQRVMQGFAKFDRSKSHCNGSNEAS